MAHYATVGATIANVEKDFVSSGSLVPTVLLPVLWLVITAVTRPRPGYWMMPDPLEAAQS